MPIAWALIVPRAGSPTSGEAIVSPLIVVSKSDRVRRIHEGVQVDRRDGDVADAVATAGARMIVSRAFPGTKLESVLVVSAEARLTNGSMLTLSV